MLIININIWIKDHVLDTDVTNLKTFRKKFAGMNLYYFSALHFQQVILLLNDVVYQK